MTSPTTSTELRLLDLGPDDQDLLRATFDQVLRPSFTQDELSDLDAVRPTPGRLVAVATLPDGTPLGCAVTELHPAGVSLLCYLAVSPASRGLGVGGLLVAHLREHWARTGCALVLAEVHDPRGHADTADEHPQARLRFYSRTGARVLGVPFVQPALDGGARVPDMLLLVMAGPAADATTVPAAPVRAWVTAYFAGAEGGAPTDPQGAALLELLAVEELPILPFERWQEVPRLEVG